MPTITSDYSVVAEAIKDLYELDTSIGLEAIYYGDQDKIGSTPCIVIEPGPTEDRPAGANFRTEHTFTMFLILYLARIQSTQTTRLELDQMVAKAVSVLHADKQLGGLVIHSQVIRREPGYARNGSQLRNAARITWQGMSLTYV
jgi:hypothetical protein